MSAQILGSVCHADHSNSTFHSASDTYAQGMLGSWSLQRMPHQTGRWYVSLFIRGMHIGGYAVQDDFGDLQMVEV